ncbi:ribonuclease H-like domain-containing protein [Metasolibacillus meyeri]|uniref:ribonuclease H-like domain-containing protein n=1 Tax=Metasolibacillus meyeri TaxID=1071052 RepID=UPI000D2F9305|nr:ribonuclease H-like domain-containing protein [Metasolibacillus meyeri]
MSYENKILQMKKMLGKKTAEHAQQPKFVKPATPFYTAAWQQAGLTLVENDFGVLFKREVRYPCDYVHGHYQLGELTTALEAWGNAEVEHPYALHTDDHILFWDTETTGLKGTGTYIFLLGFLEQEEDEFVLTQYVLADPANEAALLFASKLWQQSVTLVSYNGKSFDWPQLETRWTLNRQTVPPLKEQQHIDLLHSSKRLWKNDLQKMKLVQVEEEKLGFKRQDDIPGHLAPIIYFDAVKSGQAEVLMKVLQHNEWDLLSLITLYIHQTKLLFTSEQESAVTYTNIGKWYGDLKQQAASEYVLTNVTESYRQSETALAHFYLAFQHKRSGRYQDAVSAFEAALIGISQRQKIQAYEQLSMLHEHQIKKYDMALFYVEKGLQLIQQSDFSVEQKEKHFIKWNKRYERIQNKQQ